MPLTNELWETERRYFEAGARVVPVPGATLVHMPAFQDIPAAAVVQRLDPTAITPDPLAWLVHLETISASLGLPRSRLYVDQSTAELDLALAMLGYRARVEIGLTRRPAPIRRHVDLVPITDDDGWRHKFAVHTHAEDGPDGFALEPSRWVTFERAKVRSGYLTAYLAMERGVPVGAVGTARFGGVLRLKNLVVASAHRRRGVGAAIVAAVVQLAHEQGCEAVGMYAFPGTESERMYRGVGFTETTQQTGWDRALTPSAPARLSARRMHAYG